MKVRITHSPYASNMKKFDEGGDIASPISGLRTIDEGGLHEENPNGGVPQGYANDGGLNLVEEGEVVYDDYVYSNRLSPSLKELESVSLPNKYKDKSFADIAKKLSDEAEERPNDPISHAGLDSSMTRLRVLQEEYKAKKAAEEQALYEAAMAADAHVGADGIHLRDGETDGSYNWTDLFNKNPEFQASNNTGFLPYDRDAQSVAELEGSDAYKAVTNYVLDNWDSDEVKLYISWLSEKTGKKDISKDYYRKARTDGKYGWFHLNPDLIAQDAIDLGEIKGSVITAEAPKEKGESDDDKDDRKPQPQQTDEEELPTWMRYAPIAGSALGALDAFLTPPDHEYSDNLRNNAQLPVRKAAFRPVESYLAYRPLDDRYLANQAAAQFNANRAAMSAGTRATGNTIAGLATLNRNAAQSIGDANMQMDAQNEARKQAVAEYNRATNQYNSTGLANVSATNASMAAARDQARAQLLERAYAARDAEDKEVEQVRSAALTNLMNNLHQLGLENTRINMANSNPALFGQLAQSGMFSGTGAGTNSKFGGKLSHKYTSMRVRRKNKR